MKATLIMTISIIIDRLEMKIEASTSGNRY